MRVCEHKLRAYLCTYYSLSPFCSRSASTNVDDQEFMSLAPAPLREMMEAFRRGFDDGGGGRGDCRLYHTDNKKCKILQEPP